MLLMFCPICKSRNFIFNVRYLQTESLHLFSNRMQLFISMKKVGTGAESLDPYHVGWMFDPLKTVVYFTWFFKLSSLNSQLPYWAINSENTVPLYVGLFDPMH